MERGVGLCEAGSLRPDVDNAPFHAVRLPYPTDSGRKVFLAKRLFSLVRSEHEALLLIDNWAVWPSSQHMPLFARFREALGEHRPLIEAPAHIVTLGEADDAVSIVATALLFFWDCYGVSDTGGEAFHISHDEYCSFASRDVEHTARVAAEFAEFT